jgi:putative addiction module component (TIGR02574 family)
MSTTEIRQKLFDYIRVADDRKVKAIYTMIEAEIEQETEIWTDEFIEELNRRTSELESGKSEGRTWEEVKASLKQLSKSK